MTKSEKIQTVVLFILGVGLATILIYGEFIA